ncbi:MAG: hypothetical protein ABIK62_05860 [candidate division WOR-3 bacterium]
MPRRSVEQRMANYSQGLNPDRIREDLQQKRERMIAAQTAATSDLAEIEDRIKGVLAEEDVTTVTYMWYYDFGRELYRLKKQHGGGQGLKKEVAIALLKWKLRGAKEDVLEKIRDEVFAISPP